MIHLYTSPTPNGWKASIALEEMKLPYKTHNIDMMAGDQKKPAFLKMNPNGRIPVIRDDMPDGAPKSASKNQKGKKPAKPKPLVVFESGAILIYLAEKTGKFMPKDKRGRSEVIQWLMFQMGGVGPMMGQANVFYRYFPEKIQPAIDRYQNEGRRLMEVLDGRLKKHEYLAGDYSIADMANWAWARTHAWSGISVEGLKSLQRWMDAIDARPACQKGIKVPVDLRDLMTREQKGEGAKEFSKNARSIVQR